MPVAELWESPALEMLSRMEEVSRAWDSLLEAKQELQRIENTLDSQDRRHGQRMQRNMKLDSRIFSGIDLRPSEASGRRSPGNEQEEQNLLDQTFICHRQATDFSEGQGSSWRPRFSSETHVPNRDMDGKNQMTHLVSMMDDGFSEDTLSNTFLDRSSPASQTSTEEVLNPYSEVYPLSPVLEVERCPKLSSCPDPRQSPSADVYAQRLEYLKNNSPNNKLKKLKERIREQKLRQNLGRELRPDPPRVTEPVGKHTLKRKVGKVTFGVPPPTYKETKDPTSKSKFKNSVSRKLSFDSPSPERRVKHSGKDVYRPSAWREGQKIVRKILGPSPVILKGQHLSSGDGLASQTPGMAKQETDGAPVWRDPPPKEKVKGRDRPSERVKRILRTNVTAVLQDEKRKGVQRDLPKRRPTTSAAQRHPNKENIRQEDRVGPRGHKHGYSTEEVRNFMNRKKSERRSKEQEERDSRCTAAQLQQRRLQEVFRKQKEAGPLIKPRTELSKQKCPATEDSGRPVAEWVQRDCSRLLGEEEGRRKETDVGHCLGPLKLRDLDTSDSPTQSPKRGPTLPQPRDSQERLQALCNVARDLARRVEVETSRLGVVVPPRPMVSQESQSPPGLRQRSQEEPTGLDDGRYQRSGSLERPQGWADITAPPCGETEKKEQGRRATKALGDEPLAKSPQKGSREHRGGRRLQSPSGSTRGLSERLGKHSPSRPSWKSGILLESALQEGEVAPANGLRKSHTDIVRKLKMQNAEQGVKLAALREKSRREAAEAEHCMEELKLKSIMLFQSDGQSEEAKPMANRQLPPNGAEFIYNTNCFKNDLKFPGESASLSKKHEAKVKRKAPCDWQAADSAMGEVEGDVDSYDRTEPATDSTSKWSEISKFYGSPNMFSRFTLEMAQQYLREEELRARHQRALLRLREEAVKEKAKAELALLEHQRKCSDVDKEPGKVEEILKQENEIQTNLKQEQAEIRHLHNIYRAAHQERKLLLRQQQEILQMRQSVTHIHEKLMSSEFPDNLPVGARLRNPVDLSEQDTHSAISDLSADDGDLPEKASSEGSLHVSGDPESSARHGGSPSAGTNLTSCYSTEGQDGAAELNPLLAEPMAESVHNNPSHLNQPGPGPQGYLAHRSQEVNMPVTAHQSLVTGAAEQKTGPQPGKWSPAAEADAEKPIPGIDRHPNHETPGQDEESSEPSPLDIEPWKFPGDVSEEQNTSGTCVQSAKSIAGDNIPLGEFCKVSAKLVNISSSCSTQDWGEEDEEDEDTECVDSEVFDMESEREAGQPQAMTAQEPISTGPCIDQSDQDQAAENTKRPLKNPKDPLVLASEMLRNKPAPLASESFPTSEDVSASDTKSDRREYSSKGQVNKAVKITNTQTSMSMSPGDVSNTAEMSSHDIKDRPTVTENNEKQFVIENLISRKMETVPSPAASPRDLFKIKSLPPRSEGEIIFITDEVLQPVGDTSSGTLSSDDERLSCDNGVELHSTKKDSSLGESIRSHDSESEDFPTPPDEVFWSECEDLESAPDDSLIDQMHLFYTNQFSEDNLLPPVHLAGEATSQDKNTFLFSTEPKTSLVGKPPRPYLTLSMVEEDHGDPLAAFAIGDRVLVKGSMPGTLRFKGLVSYQEGHRAGVELDKAEGNYDGTFEGVQYFECPKNCGVFASPEELSHLLVDDKSSIDYIDGSSSDGDPPPGNSSSDCR
eukprot:XP_004916690.1 PREDICTED: coiled-coil domain-containing protein 187 isoform X2 [Xenopus tropicalis]